MSLGSEWVAHIKSVGIESWATSFLKAYAVPTDELRVTFESDRETIDEI